MKFTKFIPLVCAFALATTGVFAETTNTMSETYQIVVPALFNITVEEEAVTQPETVTLGEDLNSLTWTGTMGVTYRVATNVPTKVFYVKATTAAGNFKAFNDNINSMKIVFSNSAPSVAVTQQDVTSALAGEDASTNKNCFAATFSRGAHGLTAGTALPQPVITANELVYTAAGSGTWTLPFSIGTSALPNTFSPADEAGTYQATVTITDVPSS